MTILVVDDEIAITEALSVALEIAGYRPVCAGNGRAGLEQFEKANPHLVITDVMMPHLDGRDLVRAIRQRPAGRDIPIILMSAAHDLAGNRDIGHDLFVPKPFDLDRLLDRVAELLASRRPASR
jgi:DNA-binding response OmpR family regulator